MQKQTMNEMTASRTLGRYWIQFAASGDPNAAGLPSWPAYRANEEEMVEFGDDVHILKGPRNDQLDAIDQYLRSVLVDTHSGKPEK